MQRDADTPTRHAIQERALAPKPASMKEQRLSEAFFDLYAGLPHRERHARSLAYALTHEPVRLYPGEGLVGTIHQACPGGGCPQWGGGGDPRWDGLSVVAEGFRRVAEELPEDAELTGDAGGAFLISGGAFPGHIGWDWRLIVEQGVLILIDRCRARAAEDPAHAPFYEGAVIAWEAVLAWNDAHVAAMEACLTDAEPDERGRLERLIALCRRVPAHPARSFHEAVQAFHFQHLTVMLENPFGGNGPGRVDTVLGPYLDRDLASGAVTPAEARGLVTEMLLKFHERLAPADGWVETIMVGGADAQGRWTGNTLSSLIVECYMELSQTHPAVYMRLAKSAPDDFVRLAARYMVAGDNRAQILNDDAIVPAMVAAGVDADDAADYMCGGCMEISAQAKAGDLRFTMIHSIPKVVELLLTGGECLITGRRRSGFGPGLAGYASFEALYAAFEAELAREAGVAVRRLDIWGECVAERRPTFLISSLVHDCLETGLDLHEGGARYNDYGTAPVGIPNAADALYAVQRALFTDGLCTAEEMLAALRADFSGHELLHRALCRLPRFGQEHAGADAMAGRVLQSVADAYAATRGRLGGRLLPMVFNFVWTPMVGGALGASPDGRRAGATVAHGLTPQASGMTGGLTAAVNSCTSLPQCAIAGGATTMWDMDPAWADEATLEAVIRAFVSRGGQIMQGNTTSVADLEAALERPADYPNLTVRVGGFSARFVGLDPAVQREIVTRYRHRGG